MRALIVWSCIAFRCFGVEPAETAGAGEGNPAKDAPAAVQAADYGPAFEQLVALGLPDARGASYVKLTLHGDAGREAEMMTYNRYSGRDDDLGLKGNAWRLPGAEGGTATLIHQGHKKVTVVKKAKRSGLMRMLVGPRKVEAAEGVQGDWTPEDVAADAKKIIKALQVPSGESERFDADRWSYSGSGAAWCAGVLTTACHMYRAGHRDEANQITELLMSRVPEPILVVDQVVNDLAQREYGQLVTAFFDSGDWHSYYDETQKLVTRFSRGWRSREGAELLLTRIQKRLQGAKPSLAPLGGVVIKPEAVAILDGWLTQKKPIFLKPRLCWLLGSNPLSDGEDEGYYGRPPSGENADAGRIEEIRGMGMDGFIALTAAATDDTLLPTRMTQGYSDHFGGSYGRRSYGGGGDDAVGIAQYASMTRPASRGEIARAILLQTLPDPEGELGAASPEDLQKTAYQWWLKNRSASISELARHFMEFGNGQQSSMAVMALIHSEDDGDAKVVEKYILEAEDLTEQFHIVTQYLRVRRGKARPFFEAYSKALRELVGEASDEDNEDRSWQIREAGGVDKYLKRLSVYVDDVSPEKLLAGMRVGTLKYDEGFPMLQAAIGDKSIVKYLPDLVTVARRQETPEEQLEALRAIQTLVYEEQGNSRDQEEIEAGQKLFAEQLALSKDDWTYFLSQDTPAGDHALYGSAPTLAAAVSWMMEVIYFPQHTETIGRLSRVLDEDEQWVFWLDRAKRLLDEGTAAEFPSAEKVDEDQRKAIRDTLKPMSVAEILKDYEGRSLNEKLAWNEILDSFGEDAPAAVRDLSKHIVKINWPNSDEKDPALKAEIEALAYAKIFDESIVEGLMGLMLKHAERYQNLTIYLQSDGAGSHGIVLSALEGGDVETWQDRILDAGFEHLR